MRKTKRTAARMQSLTACFVFFVSVFFSANMKVRAASDLIPLTKRHVQAFVGDNVFFDGLPNSFTSYPVNISIPNKSEGCINS